MSETKRHTMQELLEFMEKLREEFPSKERYDNDVRCTAGDIMRHFGMDSETVWSYIVDLSNCYLIDNNGGALRFNDNVMEDLMEIHILQAIRKAIEPISNIITMGLLDKIFSNIYRDHCFCAGKYGEMATKPLEQPTEVMRQIMDAFNKAKDVAKGEHYGLR